MKVKLNVDKLPQFRRRFEIVWRKYRAFEFAAQN